MRLSHLPVFFGLVLAVPAANAQEVSDQQRDALRTITYDTCFAKAKQEQAFIELSKQKRIDAPKAYCGCTSAKFADGVTMAEIEDFAAARQMSPALEKKLRDYGDHCMSLITGRRR